MPYTDWDERDLTVNCILPTSPRARVLHPQPLYIWLFASLVVKSMGIPYLWGCYAYPALANSSATKFFIVHCLHLFYHTSSNYVPAPRMDSYYVGLRIAAIWLVSLSPVQLGANWKRTSLQLMPKGLRVIHPRSVSNRSMFDCLLDSDPPTAL